VFGDIYRPMLHVTRHTIMSRDKNVTELTEMNELHADFVLHIISFLNIYDQGRFARASTRLYYLVHQYRRIHGPEFVAATSNSETSPDEGNEIPPNQQQQQEQQMHSSLPSKKRNNIGRLQCQSSSQLSTQDVIKNGLSQLTRPPDVAFVFTTVEFDNDDDDDDDNNNDNKEVFHTLLPSNCVAIGAISSATQSYIPNRDNHHHHHHYQLEHESHTTCPMRHMLHHFVWKI
jgi:ABC-type nickel/cobalt efflux system permease component RcnA